MFLFSIITKVILVKKAIKFPMPCLTLEYIFQNTEEAGHNYLKPPPHTGGVTKSSKTQAKH